MLQVMSAGEVQELGSLVRKAREDPEVLAVMVFGSAARGEAGPKSDVDVCLVLVPEIRDRERAAQKRLEYLAESPENLDIQIFQLLPLYVRHRVLKEGQVLFSRDEDALYELAFATIRAFEDFKHVYREYLEEVARGGP